MDKILYINGCVRAESRTDRLARAVISKLTGTLEEIKLDEADLKPLDRQALEKRDKCTASGDFSDDMFISARKFKDADIIVMSAPYWDLSFPAAVKVFIENISVTDLTFRYTEEGYPQGMCAAKKFIYVTTSGGSIGDFDFGYQYIKTVVQGMFGIEDVVSFRAENLDIYGNDPEKIMEEAIAAAEERISADE